jgi:ABC-type transport system involved in multi-copper enzyme maturation permease subunit
MAPWRLGPVFVYECVTAARRWQTYAGRTAFLALLFTSLAVVWAAKCAGDPDAANLSRLAQVGESFFYALAGTQLVLVLLAAPAYTAGAICLDKARGTLAHMLVTELSSAEIILGKLGSRLLPVLGMVLATLPILALATLLGGIAPNALFGSFVVTLGVAVASCALALALSVWGSKPSEALLITYSVLAVLLLALPAWYLLPSGVISRSPPAWLEKSNPFWMAFAPYLHSGGADLHDYLIFLGVCLGLTALLTLLATVTLRRSATRLSGRRGWWRGGLFGYWLRGIGPSLDFNPVLWREWHRRWPSHWLRVLWIVYGLLSLSVTFLALVGKRSWEQNNLAAKVNAFQYAFGLLLVCVMSVSSLLEERVRGRLEVLLTTPLSTSSIVWGKWWGAYRSALLVMVLPLAMAFYLGIESSWKNQQWHADRMVSGVLCFWPILLFYGPVGISLTLAWLTGDRGKEDWRKYWAWYRQALVFLPVVLGGTVCVMFLSLMTDRKTEAMLLLIGLMLAYGATATSLGLALATWVKRFDVAIGLSVALYVLVSGGALLALRAFGIWRVEREHGYVSPWFGIEALTSELGEANRAVMFSGGIIWGVFYMIVAVVLAGLTRCTFNRYLGRASERRFWPTRSRV